MERKAVTLEAYLQRLDLWLEVRAFPADQGLCIFFRDITEIRRIRERIEHLAHHDVLTGLPNRASFLDRLNKALHQHPAAGVRLGLMYLDLDDFKAINDTLGHDAGDAVLVAAGKRIREALPQSAFVARMGGDEFAILLTEDIDHCAAEMHAMRIRARLSQPVSYGDSQLSSKASMGIALYPASDPRPDELIKNADLALYKAKRSGGDGHAFYDPEVRQAVQKRLSALSCARDALARDAIVPYYQPKISLDSGRVCGFEALSRWTTPRFGVNSPGLIKEAFEDLKLSVELGQRMRERVIRDMVSWERTGVDYGQVAVNLSAPEFVSRTLGDDILTELANAGLATSRLELEVTESVFLGDGTSEVAHTLDKLHAHGVSIALDDFGTGYASLLHLSKFPVSWLKIDQSFVQEMCENPDKRAIVKAIIGLARSLGLQVVAEGVETNQQWHQLRKMGCDLAQGYLMAKPMSADLVPDFLKTWSRDAADRTERRVS